MAIGVGVLFAVLISVGGFLFWRGRHAPPAVSVPVTVPAPISTSPIASATPAAGNGAGGGVATASADITFRLNPAEATLSLEGQNLPGNARTVPRPAIGKTVNVVVRAKGYEDVTILVDFFTTSPMDLALKPSGGIAAPAIEPPSTPVEDLKDPPKDPLKKGPRPPKEPGVPANPY